jgi:hypothetical protein
VNKPRHSQAGFRRYMQMSATRIFILVEGKRTDPFIYGGICGPLCEIAGREYEIVRADRIEGSGGKQTLIGLYYYLEDSASLIGHTKTGASFCIFYLDKDVDDVFGDLITSPHVVYTPFYNIENSLFIHGNVVTAAAAAASLDIALIQARIPEAAAWRGQRADAWKDFVVLCLFSGKHDVNCDCTYGCHGSPLNNPPEAPTDAEKANARRAVLRGLLAEFSEDEFNLKYRAAARLVERIYGHDAHDVIFNGKWYVLLLIREIELATHSEFDNRHALSNSILAALAATLDFTAGWTEYFKNPLLNLIAAT